MHSTQRCHFSESISDIAGIRSFFVHQSKIWHGIAFLATQYEICQAGYLLLIIGDVEANHSIVADRCEKL